MSRDEVLVGDVYRDNDPRMTNRPALRVVELAKDVAGEPCAIVEEVTRAGTPRRFQHKVRRLRRGGRRGFTLVSRTGEPR